MKPPPQSRNLGTWGDVLLAWLPFLVVFLSIPTAVFVPNAIEFSHDYAVLTPFLIAVIASFVVLAALLFLLPQGKGRFVHGLFFLGFFLLLSDMVTPLNWGLLDGESKLKEPLEATLIQLALLTVLALCWWKFPARLVRAFGIPLVLVVFAAQVATLLIGLLERPEADVADAATATTENGEHSDIVPPLRSGNIYHLVFDGYSGMNFLPTLEKMNRAEAFRGFTYFSRVLANYHMTDASVPSFLTGQFYNEGSFKAWQEEAKTGGLRGHLRDAGFKIEVYSPDEARHWTFDRADHLQTSQEISKSYFVGSDAFRLLLVSLVRIAPNPLRQETFWLLDRLFGYLIAAVNDTENPGAFTQYGFYKRISVPLLQQFLEDEPERASDGRYIYLHVILPHGPFVWSESCEYTGRSSYQAQTLCATHFMDEIVGELKRLDRFDDSLIILQSDHGYHRKAGGEPDFSASPSPEVLESIAKAMKYTSVEGYLRRIHPLMAIKPPGASDQPLRISQAPAQLVDLPATVYDLIDVAGPSTDGLSMFSLAEDRPREIHLYAGVYTRDAEGAVLVLGAGMQETALAHTSYTSGLGWRLYPNHPARYE